MRRRKGGRGKPLPYGVNAKPWGEYVSAGRRGRRPLRDGAKMQAWCADRGRGKPLPYGVSAIPERRCVSAGRRGRRPLRVGAGPFVFVVGAAALGRPRTWMKVGETVRRGRRPLRDGAKP